MIIERDTYTLWAWACALAILSGAFTIVVQPLDVYSGHLRLYGEHVNTCLVANNYASSLIDLRRFEEAKGVLRETIPMAQRVTGANHAVTLKIRWCYAEALYKDPAATLADLREVVTTLEDIERIARQVLGSAHPMTKEIGDHLRLTQAVLRARS